MADWLVAWDDLLTQRYTHCPACGRRGASQAAYDVVEVHTASCWRCCAVRPASGAIRTGKLCWHCWSDGMGGIRP